MKSIFIVTVPTALPKEQFSEIMSALKRTLENDYYSFLFCDPTVESLKFQVFSPEGEVSPEKLEVISKLIAGKEFGIEIRGRSLKEWELWIIEELRPPITVDNEQKYVLEAFLELIQKCKQ